MKKLNPIRKKTSKYKGVSRFRDKWRARYRRTTIGIFDLEDEAAQAYNLFSKCPNQLKQKFICTKCSMLKDKREFPPDKRKVNKISSVCRDCHSLDAQINTALMRKQLVKNEETLNYLKIERTIKLISKKLITKDEARDLLNQSGSINRAFSIRVKGTKVHSAGNTL